MKELTCILVCGSRNWTNKERVFQLLDYTLGKRTLTDLTWQVPQRLMTTPFEDIVILEGGCYTGADHFARDYARDNELTFINVPANWNRVGGKAAGPIRNKKMVDWYEPVIVVAFHDDISNSKGTKNMVEYALKVGIPVIGVTNSSYGIVKI